MFGFRPTWADEENAFAAVMMHCIAVKKHHVHAIKKYSTTFGCRELS